MQPEQLDEVHRFWFGDLRSEPDIPEDRMALWFGGRPETDALIRERFGALIEEAAAEAEDLDLDALTPNQQLGLIVMLDQFPRSVHRGSELAFRHDELARRIAGTVADDGLYMFAPIERMFAVLPFGHSETLDDQQWAIERMMEDILPSVDAELPFWRGALRQARLYHDIIARFGRFPHRNAALGRTTTAEEAAFMAETRMTPG